MSKYLIITKDDIDVSGKTFRESEEKLSELLPELTKELLTSSIILSQGMPNKFSANKPSGRKELLEKLTKSDFMLEDVKNRISARSAELSNKFRELEDKALVDRTNLNTYSNSLNLSQAKLNSAIKPDFETEIKNLTEHMKSINADIENAKKEVKSYEDTAEKINADLLAKTTEKANTTQQLNESYTAATSEIKAEKITLETKLRAAEANAKAFKTNPGVCPACGQKLPNAEHILKEKEKTEAEIKTLTEQLNIVNKDLAAKDKLNMEYIADIKAKYDADILSLTTALTGAKNNLNNAKNNLNDFSHYYDLDKEALNKKINARDNWDKEQADLADTIKNLTTMIDGLNQKLKENEVAKAEINEHLQRIRWLDTLTKRDFRGFILADIIKYIDTKAKAYAKTVFGCENLNIYLDGNSLDISYDGKMFDNLSGGEKTRVDLIIQFAIRDLLTTYMKAGSNILVLDEVTDFLDATSCEAVMKMIETDLKAVESVFIISHHAEELNLPIDTKLHVYKDEDGISSISQK